MTSAPPTEYLLMEFYASRRPIRRFLVALAVASAALLVVWWAGVFAPRLSADVSSGAFDLSSRTGTIELELVNEAPTPVRIHNVDIPMDGFEVSSASVDGRALAVGPEVGGGSSAVLQVNYRAEGCPGAHHGGTVPVRLQVEPPGRTRSETFLHAAFPTADGRLPWCE